LFHCLNRLKNALEKRKKKGSKKHRKSQIEGDSEGESDEGEENTEGNLAMEQERLEAEKQSILQNKELLEEVLKLMTSLSAQLSTIFTRKENVWLMVFRNE